MEGKDDILKKDNPTSKPAAMQAQPKQVEVKIPDSVNETPAQNTGQGKTRKKRESSPAVKPADPVLYANLNMFITALSGGMARITKIPIWQFTPEESQAISEPAARILERIGAAEVTGKYGDYIALTMALGMAVIPRIVLMQQIKKAKGPYPQPNREEEFNNEPAGQSEKPVYKNTGRNNEASPSDLANVIDNRLPALAD